MLNSPNDDFERCFAGSLAKKIGRCEDADSERIKTAFVGRNNLDAQL